MKKYTINISENAQEDLRSLSNAISYKYKTPPTAKKYLKGLYDEMRKLSYSAESYSIQTRTSLQQYGANVRRINYKEMAIIYTVHINCVNIHRVVPGNMIKDL